MKKYTKMSAMADPTFSAQCPEVRKSGGSIHVTPSLSHLIRSHAGRHAVVSSLSANHQMKFQGTFFSVGNCQNANTNRNLSAHLYVWNKMILQSDGEIVIFSLSITG